MSLRGARPWVLAGLLLVLGGPAARADAVSSAELRSLAGRAAHDPAALRQLRSVTRVDGAPADLRRALAGAHGAALLTRLDGLRRGAGPAAAVSATAARAQARAVLAQARFHERAGGLHPLRGVLGWLGDRLAPLGRPYRWLAGFVPGGDATLFALGGALVALVAALLARRSARARLAAARAAPRARPGGEARDPARLEASAEEAERAGAYEQALRLRFRAGLLRLARERAIPDDLALTSGQVARRLGSPAFARLARTFDEVVYGRRAASARDAAEARDGWPQVVREAAGR